MIAARRQRNGVGLGPNRFGQRPVGRDRRDNVFQARHRGGAPRRDAVRIRLDHHVARAKRCRDVRRIEASRRPDARGEAGVFATHTARETRGFPRRSTRTARRSRATRSPEARRTARRRRVRRTCRSDPPPPRLPGRFHAGTARSRPERRLRECSTGSESPGTAAARRRRAGIGTTFPWTDTRRERGLEQRGRHRPLHDRDRIAPRPRDGEIEVWLVKHDAHIGAGAVDLPQPQAEAKICATRTERVRDVLQQHRPGRPAPRSRQRLTRPGGEPVGQFVNDNAFMPHGLRRARCAKRPDVHGIAGGDERLRDCGRVIADTATLRRIFTCHEMPNHFLPGGFAPPDHPTRSLAGTPTPRAARVAHSLRSFAPTAGPTSRAVRQTLRKRVRAAPCARPR